MARQQQEGDVLFDIKNAYYIGDYLQCIYEAQKSKVSASDLVVERDAFMYRAYIAQGKYRVVLDEIKSTSNEKLQHVRKLAEFLAASPDKRDALLTAFSEKPSHEESDDFNMYRLVLSTMYYKQGYLTEALEQCFDVDDLEVKALSIQIYLDLHRNDLAKGELKKLMEKDEDATVTQLAQAWLHIAQGGDKLQEAFYIYQELIEKYDQTSMLLNGQAVVYIGQGKYSNAEEVLQDCLTKDNNNPDTYINMIVLSHHLGKPDVAKRYFSQMKDDFPHHPYVQRMEQKKTEFQRLCKSYAPTIPASA